MTRVSYITIRNMGLQGSWHKRMHHRGAHALQRGRTNQCDSAIAVFLHLKALPAALAILEDAAVGQPQQAALRVLSLVWLGVCDTSASAGSFCTPQKRHARAASSNQYASWGQACLRWSLQLSAQLGQLRLELPQVVLCGLQCFRHRTQCTRHASKLFQHLACAAVLAC